jgi:hypothetical protein
VGKVDGGIIQYSFTRKQKHDIGGKKMWHNTVLVLDGEKEECANPGEMGAILEAGEARGPGPPGDVAKCLRAQETGLPQHQATFMHRVCIIVYCVSVYRINNHNTNRVLLYYLFQENKSFGSKKPFAFILWCTRSCVEHSTV